MNVNHGIQHSSKLAWSGLAAFPIDIRRHVGFSFSFEVKTALAADTKFNVMSAPPSDADICLPGAFVPVPEVLTCVADFGVQPLPQAVIVLPAGTPAGSHCTATLPCRPDAFLQLAAGGGDTANVVVTAGLHGPK
jgi:hypothetical protein